VVFVAVSEGSVTSDAELAREGVDNPVNFFAGRRDYRIAVDVPACFAPVCAAARAEKVKGCLPIVAINRVRIVGERFSVGRFGLDKLVAFMNDAKLDLVAAFCAQAGQQQAEVDPAAGGMWAEFADGHKVHNRYPFLTPRCVKVLLSFEMQIHSRNIMLIVIAKSKRKLLLVTGEW